MNIKEAPIIKILRSGNSFKVLQVRGREGMSMPEHFSTREAVIIIQQGSATLKMEGRDHALARDQSFIIPGGVRHRLSMHEAFQALVVMDIDSEIKFVDS